VEVVIVVPTTLLGLLLPSDLAASSWPTKNLSLLSAADDYLLVVPSSQRPALPKKLDRETPTDGGELADRLFRLRKKLGQQVLLASDDGGATEGKQG